VELAILVEDHNQMDQDRIQFRDLVKMVMQILAP